VPIFSSKCPSVKGQADGRTICRHWADSFLGLDILQTDGDTETQSVLEAVRYICLSAGSAENARQILS